MCFSGQPALKVRLVASSKRDGNEGRWSRTFLQQPRLCGMSARVRSRVALRKILVEFSELVFFHAPPLTVFVALECHNCAALAKAKPTQPSLRISSAFLNSGGAVEDTQGSCMIERRRHVSGFVSEFTSCFFHEIYKRPCYSG